MPVKCIRDVVDWFSHSAEIWWVKQVMNSFSAARFRFNCVGQVVVAPSLVMLCRDKQFVLDSSAHDSLWVARSWGAFTYYHISLITSHSPALIISGLTTPRSYLILSFLTLSNCSCCSTLCTSSSPGSTLSSDEMETLLRCLILRRRSSEHLCSRRPSSPRSPPTRTIGWGRLLCLIDGLKNEILSFWLQEEFHQQQLVITKTNGVREIFT